MSDNNSRASLKRTVKASKNDQNIDKPENKLMVSEDLPELGNSVINDRELTDRSSVFVANPVNGRGEKVQIFLVIIHCN